MKLDIFKSIFCKKTQKQSDQSKSIVQNKKLENKIEQNGKQFSTLFFTFYYPYSGEYDTIEYDIIQIKRKDDTIKCIAKLSKKSIQTYHHLKVDFLKQIIIFPFNQLNKIKALYFDKDRNIYYNKTWISILDFEIPYCAFTASLDEDANITQLHDYIKQKISYISNNAIKQICTPQTAYEHLFNK